MGARHRYTPGSASDVQNVFLGGMSKLCSRIFDTLRISIGIKHTECDTNKNQVTQFPVKIEFSFFQHFLFILKIHR